LLLRLGEENLLKLRISTKQEGSVIIALWQSVNIQKKISLKNLFKSSILSNQAHDIYQGIHFQPALVFAIFSTRISVAPTDVRSSITVAISFFSTIELTATHPSSSNALIVGARFPGVILVATARLSLLTLYWQRTYF